MLTVPERIKGVTHPLISSLYLKRNSGDFNREDVLVIKTNYDETGDEYDNFDSYLMDLLNDLKDLRSQAEKSAGMEFDRVDIRT